MGTAIELKTVKQQVIPYGYNADIIWK